MLSINLYLDNLFIYIFCSYSFIIYKKMWTRLRDGVSAADVIG